MRKLLKAELPVVEMFSGIQGEGQQVGALTIFLRLYGCNLQCPFCDTKYASNNPNTPIETVSVRELVARLFGMGLSKRGPYNLCITGGEPLIHYQAVDLLTKTLYSTGFPLTRISIQTNGTIPINQSSELAHTYLCVSPKPPDYKVVVVPLELKIVITEDIYEGELLEKIKNLCANFKQSIVEGRLPVFLQPVSIYENGKWLPSSLAFRKAIRIGKLLDFPVRILPQVHRLLQCP